MILTDFHTHTEFSADSQAPIEEMIETAIKKGLKYYGISEHINYDYDECGLKFHDQEEIDPDKYFERARFLQEKYKKDITLLVGAEFGFNDSENCKNRYLKFYEKYSPDYVVNGVHTCLNEECYFPEFSKNREKRYAYGEYFKCVLESIDAPYHYDIVAHIGYCSRNAVYEDKKIRYAEYSQILDKILTKIIEKDKILEVNTSSRSAGSEFIPDTDILQRYFDLGGRKISFGSDAHFPERICEKYQLVINALKEIGFTCLTIPLFNEHVKIEI